jgi:hypothetical protein
MATAKKDKDMESEAVPQVKRPVVLVRAPRDKVYSFEQWAKLRNKPDRHLNGMRAFLGTEAGNKYTLDAWDAKMMAY